MVYCDGDEAGEGVNVLFREVENVKAEEVVDADEDKLQEREGDAGFAAVEDDGNEGVNDEGEAVFFVVATSDEDDEEVEEDYETVYGYKDVGFFYYKDEDEIGHEEEAEAEVEGGEEGVVGCERAKAEDEAFCEHEEVYDIGECRFEGCVVSGVGVARNSKEVKNFVCYTHWQKELRAFKGSKNN